MRTHNKSQSGWKWKDTRGFKHTGKASEDKSDNATVAMKLEETKRMNGV